MYGARSAADLAVTRFYAPQHIYKVMKKSMNIAIDVGVR
jgi:hypothetical protein